MTLSLTALRSDVARRVRLACSLAALHRELAETRRTLDRLRACANQAVQGQVHARNEADVSRRLADGFAQHCAGLERTVAELQAQVCELEAQLAGRDGFEPRAVA